MVIKEEKTTSQAIAFQIELNTPKQVSEKENPDVKKRLE